MRQAPLNLSCLLPRASVESSLPSFAPAGAGAAPGYCLIVWPAISTIVPAGCFPVVASPKRRNDQIMIERR
ncbi:hypothetical protein C2I19_05965 [Chromobacterium alticapitis]|uniref:Uncharacterized protein n=1 Tax=Chromobacterium alticapitis TaxID=2073169 RepID=A0A2S5DIL6_9NEIS|nr:hypothetical protein C2I19_05965 [Chromobacterium alticapitis]